MSERAPWTKVLWFIDRVVLATTPVTPTFAAIEVSQGTYSHWLTLYVGLTFLAAIVAVLGLMERAPWRGPIYAIYTMGIAVVATGHFGPLLGSGVLLGMSTVVGVIFLRRLELVVYLAGGVFSVVLVTVLRTYMMPGLSLEPVAVVRVATAATLGVLVIATLGTFVLGQLETAAREARNALVQERREREDRELAQEELAKAQRSEMLGRLAGGVAHDVNNALAVVLGNLDVLKSIETPEAKEVVEDIEAATLGARDVVRDLLYFGRQDTETSDDECAPDRLALKLGRTLRRLVPERISISVEPRSREHVGLARAQLERILINLVLNARDAIPGAGDIRISTRDDGSRLVIEVRDTGTGIPEHVQDHLFEPFYTTKGEGRGTGLGLATVRSLVERAEGAISFETSPAGTTIRMDFPALPHVERDEEISSPTIFARLDVLVVEDEPAVRRSLERLLRSDGHNVRSASNEAEARESSKEGRLDLLITDAVMPETDTQALIDAVQGDHPEASVLICSGWVEEELVRQGIQAGDYALLPKPFTRDALRGALGRILLRNPGAIQVPS